MKVLDPQSALLTNVEVYQFLKANPPRTIDIQVGAYPTVNLAGHSTVRKDVSPKRRRTRLNSGKTLQSIRQLTCSKVRPIHRRDHTIRQESCRSTNLDDGPHQEAETVRVEQDGSHEPDQLGGGSTGRYLGGAS